MKISFYPQSCVPIHATTLDERPLGGTETGIIRLAEELSKRGHDVIVYTAQPYPKSIGAKYLPFQAAARMESVDVFVVIREWFPVLANIPAKKIFFWTGDAANQVHNFGVGDLRVA